MRYTKGFTLIELMIVIAIIGILAALALPAYQDYTIRTKVVEGLGLAGPAKTAVVETWQTNGTVPDQASTAFIFNANSSDFVSNISIANDGSGKITIITRNTGATTNPRLELDPNFDPDRVVDWTCYTRAGDFKHVPADCRN